jgi:hypothetical protein
MTCPNRKRPEGTDIATGNEMHVVHRVQRFVK